MTSLIRVVALTIAVTLSRVAWAAVPEPTGRVTDNAGVLSDQERQNLSRLLSAYENETTHQIAVLTVQSLAGERIETYSLRVANAWGVGRRGLNNGILIVLAPSDQSVRIELGTGFEAYISSTRVQEIVSRQMLPAFRRQAYAEGLEQAVRELMKDGRAWVVPRQATGRLTSTAYVSPTPPVSRVTREQSRGRIIVRS